MNKPKSSLLVGGLVVAAIILGFVLVPNILLGASPLLLLFVLCPLMMVFMMGSMHRGMDHNQEQPYSGHNPYGIVSSKKELTHEEQLTELKFQSSNLQKQQETLTHRINQMEALSPRSSTPAPRTSDNRFEN